MHGGELEVAKRRLRVHPLGDRADPPEIIEGGAVRLHQPRRRQHPPRVGDHVPLVGALEQGFGYGVVHVVLPERLGVAPLGHDGKLRVVLEIGRGLGLEVGHAEIGQPPDEPGGGHVRRPLPELDAVLAIGPGRHLRAEPFRRFPPVHLEIIGDVAALRLFIGPFCRLVRKHRVGLHLREIRPEAKHHDPELLVLDIGFDRRDHDPHLDVRLDDARHSGFLVNIEKGHVGKIARVVVSSCDEGRRGGSAAGQKDIAAAEGSVLKCIGGGHRRHVVGLDQGREGARGRLEHDLFQSGPPAVKQPVETVPDGTVVHVPAFRLPLEKAPRFCHQVDVIRKPLRTGGHHGPQAEEIVFQLRENRCVRTERRGVKGCQGLPAFAEVPVNGRLEAVAAYASRLPEGCLEGVPCCVLLPHERLAGSTLGDYSVGRRDEKQGKKDNHRQHDPRRDLSFSHDDFPPWFRVGSRHRYLLQHIRFPGYAQPVPEDKVKLPARGAGLPCRDGSSFVVRQAHHDRSRCRIKLLVLTCLS